MKKILIQNASVTANAIQICGAVVKELSGNGLDGNEMKELEDSFALELNNLVMEKVQ